ncbi:ABC transporter permease [Paenibacillus sp. XY044]|uniref:ABC transporter permease n=1 Tax=Paenibacillus sp. XY044 TaxID=2026089 RepID=UPI000B98679E|nr:ABC transporter permease [Paenibacillus sp. XY044]OZB92958.1 ABC transporter permease [Paenibacillus sp. XY044]
MSFLQFVYRNVARSKRTYAAYFLSSAFSVMIFFICALFLFSPYIRGQLIYPIVMQTMITAECIMYLFSFFFVLYSVGSFLTSRKREIGILLMHGMTKGQLNRMVLMENMLIGLGAILTGMAAGLITGKLFLMIGSRSFGMAPIPFYLPWQALALTAGAFVLLFLLISVCTSVMLRNRTLIELFQSGHKPKTPPRTSGIQSLLAVVLLLASYALAATTTVNTIYIRMLPVVIMTIAGTYFLYTQLGVWVVRLLQKRRPFFWKRTNIVTVSNLAYRLKDNAHMLFMVTIISTVSFCAVGVFASINTLSGQFREDYPAAVSYLSKGENPSGEQHVRQLEGELRAKGLRPVTVSFPVKNIRVSLPAGDGGSTLLPIISYSSYKQAVEAAGESDQEKPLEGIDALVMISSERDRTYTRIREREVYTLAEEGLQIREIGYTSQVPVPEHVLREMKWKREGDFSGLVVSDLLFDRLTVPVSVDRYTGFYVEDFERTLGLGEQLAARGEVRYDAGQPYAMTVSGTLYVTQMTSYRAMLFAALLVGTVFFIAAGSFLYFRLYADLDYDRRQYDTIAKMGLTDRELNRIVTGQLAMLFFVPILLAALHSIFAFMALQSFYYLSIAWEMGAVLACFVTAQVAYFFFIRYNYLRNVRKTLI